MNLVLADWRRLRRALALFIALSLAGGTILGLSLERRQQAQTRKANALEQKQRIQKKLGRIREEEKEIQAHGSLFRRLDHRGMVGEEKRLDWIELLQDIGERRHLTMEYEFSPRRPLFPGQEGWGLHSSTLDLGLELLHEGDLLRTLDDLQRHARALVRVRRCELTKAAPDTAGSGENISRLQAQCRLEWITLAKTGLRPGNEGGKP